MKQAFTMAIGMAIGTAIYDGIKHGLTGIEFGRVAFMFIFSWLFLAIYYTFKERKTSRS